MNNINITSTMISRWNDVAAYTFAPEHYNPQIRTMLGLESVPYEQSRTAAYHCLSEAEINAAIDRGQIDSLCVEIVCRIAASKYLTVGMLSDFLALQGLEITRSAVQVRLELLESCGFVHTVTCQLKDQVTLRCYGLGENGGVLAQEAGIANYSVLQFHSPQQRIQQGYCPEIPAHSIKRCLQANRMVLAMLCKKAPISRFGMMPTVSAPGYRSSGCILRTSLGLVAENGDQAMVEVVRRTSGCDRALTDKVTRFHQLRALCPEETTNLSFVICAEDASHRRQLARMLADRGLLCPEILFTCDRESLLHPRIFFTAEDKKLLWVRRRREDEDFPELDLPPMA